jgi:hypothetical protein
MGGHGVLVLGWYFADCTLQHVCTEQLIEWVLLLSKVLQLISMTVSRLLVTACTLAHVQLSRCCSCSRLGSFKRRATQLISSSSIVTVAPEHNFTH